jgi:YD repeat-containing protein
LGEQLEAIDDKGDKTVSTYDWLGRRISRVHPDAGLSSYTYDLAGNLTSLQTANLLKTGGFISYSYHYERLTDVTYPLNPENNVHYEYGVAGASDNRAGRVVLQEDASGAQEFYYGPLGEVVKNIRTVVIPSMGPRPTPPSGSTTPGAALQA